MKKQIFIFIFSVNIMAIESNMIKDVVISTMVKKTIEPIEPIVESVIKEPIFFALSYIPVIDDISNNILERIQFERIMENKKFLEKVNDEIKILGIEIDKNQEKIKEFNKIFSKYDKKLFSIRNNIHKTEKYININHNEIQEIKDGIFKQALNSLKKYINNPELLDNTKRDFLSRATYGFELSNKINNSKVYNLSQYLLIYINYERYEIDKESVYLKGMEESFNKLIKITKVDNINLNLLNLSYVHISRLDKLRLKSFKDKLKAITQDMIEKNIKNKEFEKSLNIGNDYYNITGENILYNIANKKRIENSEKISKTFKSIKQIFKLIKENNNNLLNAEAVRYLYKNNYFTDAKELLRTKDFDGDFRIRAFRGIKKYLNDKKGVEEIDKFTKKYPDSYLEGIISRLKN